MKTQQNIQFFKLRSFGISRENENNIVKRNHLKGSSLKSFDLLFQSFNLKDFKTANLIIHSLIESHIDDIIEINGYFNKKSG